MFTCILASASQIGVFFFLVCRERQRSREMDVFKVLHMNSGVGDTSYAKNSLLQQKAISIAWPIMKEALEDFCSQNFPTTLTLADLGCSSGPNTLMIVSNLIKQVEEFHKKLHKKPLQYQIFFNDLPANDFNAIFRLLPSSLENLKTQIGVDFGQCFFNGVPGSFYGRLFPNKSLHFVHSSYSLHWLSQVPEGMEINNKGNMFIDSTSPKNVVEGFYRQFQKDFSMFLKCRAEEVVIGGRMVLTMLGRTNEHPSNEDYCYAMELLNIVLKNMVAEGIVEEEKFDTFNIPNFMPCPSEIKAEVLKEGSFTINRLELSRINWNFYNTEFIPPSEYVDNSYNIAKCIRSVTEPLLISHFGEAIIEELFYRYRKIVKDVMAKKNCDFINLTISLSKIK